MAGRSCCSRLFRSWPTTRWIRCRRASWSKSIGSTLKRSRWFSTAAGHSTAGGSFASRKCDERMTAASPLAVLLLQITAILVIAKVTAALVARAGQPAVVGEMLGGILLGPSFFGWLWPSVRSGMAWRDSLALGVLMNTRGLMELIVLNVGYSGSCRRRSFR